MDITKRTLTTTEESVIKWQLLVDIDSWVTTAVDGKISKCKKRMLSEWLPKLYADDSVDSIPASEDEIVAMIVARDDYKNRVVRDQGYPEGDPSTDWELSELQKYCDDNDIEHYPVAIEAVEAVEAVAGVEAVEEVLWAEGDDLPEGVEVGDVKVAAVDAVEAVVAVEAVEAQSKDTKASLLAAIASN